MLVSLGLAPSYLYKSGIIPRHDRDSGYLKQRSIIQSQIDRVSSLNISEEEKEKRATRLNELLSGIDKKIQDSEKNNPRTHWAQKREANSELRFIQGLYGNSKLVPFINKERILNSLLSSKNNLKGQLVSKDNLIPTSQIERKINSLTGNMIRQSMEMNNLLTEVDFSDNWESAIEKQRENNNLESKEDREKISGDKDQKEKTTIKEEVLESKFLNEKMSTYRYFSVSNVEFMLKNNYKQDSEMRVLDLAL